MLLEVPLHILDSDRGRPKTTSVHLQGGVVNPIQLEINMPWPEDLRYNYKTFKICYHVIWHHYWKILMSECNILLTCLLRIHAIYTPFMSHAMIHQAPQNIATISSKLQKFFWAGHAFRATIQYESPEFPSSRDSSPPRVKATNSSWRLLLWSVLWCHKTGFL
jgi:hypothetical protein